MNPKKILIKSIKDHQAAIDKATADLAALDKPELRHGDYGYVEQGQKSPRLYTLANNGELEWSSKTIKMGRSGPNPEINITGNIFDDLARNSVDLKEFKVDAAGASGDGFLASIMGSNIRIICRRYLFDTGEATKIHQQLGRLLAFFKRKQ